MRTYSHIAKAQAELTNGFLDTSRKLRLAELSNSEEQRKYKAQVNQYKKWLKQANKIAQNYQYKRTIFQTQVLNNSDFGINTELDTWHSKLNDLPEYTDELIADTRKCVGNSHPKRPDMWSVLEENPELARRIYNNPSLEDYQELEAVLMDEYDGKASTIVEQTFPEYFWLRKENAKNFIRQANRIYILFKNNIISAKGELTEHGKDLIGQSKKEAEEYREASDFYRNLTNDINAVGYNPLLIPFAVSNAINGWRYKKKAEETENEARDLELKIKETAEELLGEEQPGYCSKAAKVLGVTAMCVSAFSLGAALLGSGGGAKEVQKEVSKYQPKSLSSIVDSLEYNKGISEGAKGDELQWSSRSNMTTAIGAAGYGVVDNKIYIIGGWNEYSLSTVEIYDPSTDSWTSGASMPTSRDRLAVSVINKHIYAMGGVDINREKATVERYDTISDSWDKVASLPEPLYEFAAGVVNGKIYALSGVGSYSYNPDSDTWSSVSDMPTPRVQLTASVLNSKIYTLGGNDGSSLRATVEVYDPSIDLWTTVKSMPTARAMLTSAVLEGKIYAIGGFTKDYRTSKKVESYDPTSNSWSIRPSLPTERVHLASGSVNERIYAIGGLTINDDPLAVVEAYGKPITWTPSDITLTEISNLPDGYDKINLLHLLAKDPKTGEWLYPDELAFYRINSDLIVNVLRNPESVGAVKVELYYDYGPLGKKETKLIDLVEKDLGVYTTTLINKTARGEVKQAIDDVFGQAVPFLEEIMDIIDQAPKVTATQVVIDGRYIDVQDEVIEQASEKLDSLSLPNIYKEIGARSPIDFLIKDNQGRDAVSSPNILYLPNSHPEIAIIPDDYKFKGVIGTDNGEYGIVFKRIKNGQVELLGPKYNQINLGEIHTKADIFPDAPIEQMIAQPNYTWVVPVAGIAIISIGGVLYFIRKKNVPPAAEEDGMVLPAVEEDGMVLPAVEEDDLGLIEHAKIDMSLLKKLNPDDRRLILVENALNSAKDFSEKGRVDYASICAKEADKLALGQIDLAGLIKHAEIDMSLLKKLNPDDRRLILVENALNSAKDFWGQGRFDYASTCAEEARSLARGQIDREQ